jgi:hypothetical protein
MIEGLELWISTDRIRRVPFFVEEKGRAGSSSSDVN